MSDRPAVNWDRASTAVELMLAYCRLALSELTGTDCVPAQNKAHQEACEATLIKVVTEDMFADPEIGSVSFKAIMMPMIAELQVVRHFINHQPIRPVHGAALPHINRMTEVIRHTRDYLVAIGHPESGYSLPNRITWVALEPDN